MFEVTACRLGRLITIWNQQIRARRAQLLRLQFFQLSWALLAYWNSSILIRGDLCAKTKLEKDMWWERPQARKTMSPNHPSYTLDISFFMLSSLIGDVTTPPQTFVSSMLPHKKINWKSSEEDNFALKLGNNLVLSQHLSSNRAVTLYLKSTKCTEKKPWEKLEPSLKRETDC